MLSDNQTEININDLMQEQDNDMNIDDLPYVSFNDLYTQIKYGMKAYLPPKRFCNRKWLARIAAPDAVYLKRHQVHNADLPHYPGFTKEDLLTWIRANNLEIYIPVLGEHCHGYHREFLANVSFY